MKYAELHRNMQKYRIKSLYGNTMNLAAMTSKQNMVLTSPMLKAIDSIRPAIDSVSRIQEVQKNMAKIVDTPLSKSFAMGEKGCPSTK